MNRLLASDKIYISNSKIKGAGRGVFANRIIKKGEVVESCPVVEVSSNDSALLVDSALISYFYFLGKKKERAVLVLGFGSIYNHSHRPNAVYKERLGEGVVEFVSQREIKKDQEITVNYNPENLNEKTPLWFRKSEKQLQG